MRKYVLREKLEVCARGGWQFLISKPAPMKRKN
jgi:hypothetical protein